MHFYCVRAQKGRLFPVGFHSWAIHVAPLHIPFQQCLADRSPPSLILHYPLSPSCPLLWCQQWVAVKDPGVAAHMARCLCMRGEWSPLHSHAWQAVSWHCLWRLAGPLTLLSELWDLGRMMCPFVIDGALFKNHCRWHSCSRTEQAANQFAVWLTIDCPMCLWSESKWS